MTMETYWGGSPHLLSDLLPLLLQPQCLLRQLRLRRCEVSLTWVTLWELRQVRYVGLIGTHLLCTMIGAALPSTYTYIRMCMCISNIFIHICIYIYILFMHLFIRVNRVLRSTVGVCRGFTQVQSRSWINCDVGLKGGDWVGGSGCRRNLCFGMLGTVAACLQHAATAKNIGWLPSDQGCRSSNGCGHSYEAHLKKQWRSSDVFPKPAPGDQAPLHAPAYSIRIPGSFGDFYQV